MPLRPAETAELRMKSKTIRRMGLQDSRTRDRLLTAAQEIIQTDGISGVTARRLADAVGLQRQIVHYYFGTIDDLLVALLEKQSEESAARAIEALSHGNPIKVLFKTEKDAAILTYELMALALRRPEVGKIVAANARKFKQIATEAIDNYCAREGIALCADSTAIASVLISLANSQAVERALGVTDGHQKTLAAMANWIASVNPQGKST
jgi:AcrR family transcriptional regulator